MAWQKIVLTLAWIVFLLIFVGVFLFKF